MLLSIIIINYNTRDLTLKALHSVFEGSSTNIPFEVIVLDNNSKDNSPKALQDAFADRINLICCDTNLGFAGGNNEAAKHATGEYLLLLNPDTVVLDKAIENLLNFAREHPKAGIWGGRTLFGNNSLNPSSCWQRQTTWSLFCQALGLSCLFRKSNFFNPEGIGGWNRQGIREVDIVSGCFFLIKRDFWKKLGGFHPDFFMYGEEADLCLRAKKIGARPLVTSEATIIHYGGASEKILSNKTIRLLKAKMLLIQKHFSPLTIVTGKHLLACLPLSRYIAHSILTKLNQNKSSDAKQVWKEVWKRRKEWMTP